MRFFYLITAMFIVAQLHAQDIKGYYIGASGQKVEGFFKYGDFNDTPSVKFKTSRNTEYTSLSNDVVEYGMEEDNLKFEKHTVDIDISGNDSSQKNPEWLIQTVFLNLIVDGDTKLYSYKKDYNTKFFFSAKKKPNEISQLVYKKYKTPEGTITENTMFRQQLYNAVRCDGQDASEFMEVSCNKKQLADIFMTYNECTGSKSETFGPKRDNGISYTIIAGVYNLKLGITDARHPVDSQNSINFSFGGEVAYTVPSQKFSLFGGLEYEIMSAEITETNRQQFNSLKSEYKLDSDAVNLYFGPRYNLEINDRNKFFIDVAPGISLPFGTINETTTIITDTGNEYPGDSNNYELRTGFYFNFDLGYTFDKKYSLALRYQTKRDFLNDVGGSYKTSIVRLGITLRYTFK